MVSKKAHRSTKKVKKAKKLEKTLNLTVTPYHRHE
jgi:hypothetical protein